MEGPILASTTEKPFDVFGSSTLFSHEYYQIVGPVGDMNGDGAVRSSETSLATQTT